MSKSIQRVSKLSLHLLSLMSSPRKVTIVGSGNFASAISLNIGENVMRYPELFEPSVRMWVFPEKLENGSLLNTIINETHENTKYLPGIKLPSNIVAVSDVKEAVTDADLLIFCLPHQFLPSLLKEFPVIATTAKVLSLIKGLNSDGSRISKTISDSLQLPVSVMMGANIANEIALGSFCESTIAVISIEDGVLFQKLIETDMFRISVVIGSDVVGAVELCGALKNIVALAAGFVDGLSLGNNTKAAVIRRGILEMIRYIRVSHPNFTIESTILQSCGLADVITTCYGGRNRRLAEAFVLSAPTTFFDLEERLLKGQKLQGPLTAEHVATYIKKMGLEAKFPLMMAVNDISLGLLRPQDLISKIKEETYEN